MGGAVECMEGDGGVGSVGHTGGGGCVGAAAGVAPAPGVAKEEELCCHPFCTLASCSKSPKSIATAATRAHSRKTSHARVEGVCSARGWRVPERTRRRTRKFQLEILVRGLRRLVLVSSIGW